MGKGIMPRAMALAAGIATMLAWPVSKSNGSFTWTVRDRAESWRTANGC